MFYFLSDRSAATKYYQFEPGFTNTKEIQQKIIADLVKNKTKYIVIWDIMENTIEPNDTSKTIGVKDLDDFITVNYKLNKKFDYYSILIHKEE